MNIRCGANCSSIVQEAAGPPVNIPTNWRDARVLPQFSQMAMLQAWLHTGESSPAGRLRQMQLSVMQCAGALPELVSVRSAKVNAMLSGAPQEIHCGPKLKFISRPLERARYYSTARALSFAPRHTACHEQLAGLVANLQATRRPATR